METIRYLPRTDLAVGHYLESAVKLVSDIGQDGRIEEIESAVSVYNILRYIDDGLAEYLGNPNKANLKSLLTDYLSAQSSLDLVGKVSDVPHNLRDDFWDFITDFSIFRGIDDQQFEQFLKTNRPEITPLLRKKSLLRQFPKSIRSYFLSEPENVRFYIQQNNSDGYIDWRGEPAIPSGITSDEFNQLVLQYVESEEPSFGYLEIIAEMPSVPGKTRLLAQRRADKERERALTTASTFNVGVEVLYKEQDEPYTESYEDGTLKLSYSLNWIEENLDNPTLLNNFLYLFRLVDDQGRISLCYQEAECGVMERLMGTKRTDRYPESLAYFQKNQAALLSLHTYDRLLADKGKSIEELLMWFFTDYLRTEYGISGFQADLPSKSYALLDRCKLLAPEIERVLKQYQMYVEDGNIDLELLSISSDKFLVSSCKSLLPQKYCYLGSDDSRAATYYFFSDQCMLHYDSKSKHSYETFARRLLQSPPRIIDFEHYQKHEIDWLISRSYIVVDTDGLVRIKNLFGVAFLGEIHRNGCLNYNYYSGDAKTVLDQMISDGTFILQSGLFSRPEIDYIDFHLNRHRFINSLDLRNRYAHGSHLGSKSGENEIMHDYLQLLKILICVTIKINDDVYWNWRSTEGVLKSNI